MVEHEYCQGVFPQSTIPGTNLDTLAMIGGIIYCSMAVMTLLFIRYGASLADQIRETNLNIDRRSAIEAEPPAKSVIFPVFVAVLWAQFFVSLITGLIIAFVPLDPGQHNSADVSAVYAAAWSLQHGVIEGMAVLLQQKGCGWYATKNAATVVAGWVFIIFWFYFFFFSGGNVSIYSQLALDFILLSFYGLLWLVPLHKLFRRPALLKYAKIWFFFRLLGVLLHLALFLPDDNWPDCAYYFFRVVLFSLLQPLISYHVMYLDSLWWQGIDSQGIERPSIRMNSDERSSIRKDFSLYNAQTVASVLDRINVLDDVRMLNFAYLKVHKGELLGKGSFSAVYRGTYRSQVVAVKRIDTVDLTVDIIHRVAAEASILSSIRHTNIVGIFGVVILPPSIYIVLELCKYGSLNDVIRPGMNSNVKPLKLSFLDELFLALGCAKGLAAVHAYSSTLCHRDVKSFNFLVDSQFNVKIADLELGDVAKGVSQQSVSWSPCDCLSRKKTEGDSMYPLDVGKALSSQLIDGGINSEQYVGDIHESVRDLMPMWIAPDVLRSGNWSQASDVYSLAIVFWEIRSRAYPFDGFKFNTEIQRAILSGYRHVLPPVPSPDTDVHSDIYDSFNTLIRRGWSENPLERPSSAEIVADLERMLLSCCRKNINWDSISDYLEARLSEFSGRPSVLADKPKSGSTSSWFPGHSGPWAVVEAIPPFNIQFKSDVWIRSMQNIYSIAPTGPRSSISIPELNSLPNILSDAGFSLSEASSSPEKPFSESGRQLFADSFTKFLNSICEAQYGHIMLTNQFKNAKNLNASVDFSLHSFVVNLPSADMGIAEETKDWDRSSLGGLGKKKDPIAPCSTFIGVAMIDILEYRRNAVKTNAAVGHMSFSMSISSGTGTNRVSLSDDASVSTSGIVSEATSLPFAIPEDKV